MTVALPIISAVGAECTVMPTAVLSTHTGGFTGFTYRDLTEDIRPIVDHWKTLDLKFDAIYSGFLGSFEQIEIVAETFDRLRDNTLIVVDPVMADNGKLYTIFPEDFPMEMRKVCSKADVLMPNITEAVLLLGEEYKEGPYTSEYIDGLMERLTKLGPKKIVLTGVYFDDKKLGSATYDAETGEKSYYFCDKIPGYYHGTGDVFGSAVVAALISGRELPDASRIAVDYTVGSIQRTFDAKTDIRFGVNFEEGIPQLISDVLEDDEDLAQRISGLAFTIWHEWYSDIVPEEQIDYMLNTYHSAQSILDELVSLRLCYENYTPVFLSIAHDTNDEELKALLSACQMNGLDGVVVRGLDMLDQVAQITLGRVPVICQVSTPEEGIKALEQGALLLQITNCKALNKLLKSIEDKQVI